MTHFNDSNAHDLELFPENSAKPTPLPPFLTQVGNPNKRDEIPTQMQDVITAWNVITAGKYPKVLTLGVERRNKLRDRLKDKQFMQKYSNVFQHMIRIPFLMGKSPNGDWKAEFDWVIRKKDTYQKVLDGTYGRPEEPDYRYLDAEKTSNAPEVVESRNQAKDDYLKKERMREAIAGPEYKAAIAEIKAKIEKMSEAERKVYFAEIAKKMIGKANQYKRGL